MADSCASSRCARSSKHPRRLKKPRWLPTSQSVDQLTPPFRIAIVGLLAVVAVWFVALRPKGGGESASTTAPGVTGLANDVNSAKKAVERANGTATATTPTTGGSSSTTTPASKAKQDLASNAAPGDPSRA